MNFSSLEINEFVCLFSIFYSLSVVANVLWNAIIAGIDFIGQHFQFVEIFS